MGLGIIILVLLVAAGAFLWYRMKKVDAQDAQSGHDSILKFLFGTLTLPKHPTPAPSADAPV